MRKDLLTYFSLPFYRAMIERSGFEDDIARLRRGRREGRPRGDAARDLRRVPRRPHRGRRRGRGARRRRALRRRRRRPRPASARSRRRTSRRRCAPPLRPSPSSSGRPSSATAARRRLRPAADERADPPVVVLTLTRRACRREGGWPRPSSARATRAVSPSTLTCATVSVGLPDVLEARAGSASSHGRPTCSRLLRRARA